jgi:hypothetical protein
VTSLPLLVDGSESVLTVCHEHAAWLHSYVEDDAVVQIAHPTTDAGRQVGSEDAEGLG